MTVAEEVSITDTVSLPLATYTREPSRLTAAAVGDGPTAMACATTRLLDVSITETLPAPFTAYNRVPSDVIAMSCGASPTLTRVITVFFAASITAI